MDQDIVLCLDFTGIVCSPLARSASFCSAKVEANVYSSCCTAEQNLVAEIVELIRMETQNDDLLSHSQKGWRFSTCEAVKLYLHEKEVDCASAAVHEPETCKLFLPLQMSAYVGKPWLSNSLTSCRYTEMQMQQKKHRSWGEKKLVTLVVKAGSPWHC